MNSTTPIHSHLAGLSVGNSAPVRVMAVLNVSPESFYKGSVYSHLERLAETAQGMVNAGADIIDIGAMSTAPYLKTQITEAEETERLIQAVSTVAPYVAVPISVDTQRAQPAQAALTAGARILNDVSGLKHDPRMAALVAQSESGLVLMASETTPRSGTPMRRITIALEESLHIAAQAGIPRERIVLDPGIGFFRQPDLPWDEWDCTALRELLSLRALGCPLLVSVSRKSFIGKILGHTNPADRLVGSLACAAIAVCNGAHIIRAHDVKETVEAVRIAERLRPSRSV